jgi:hypothetical protein
MKMARDGRRNIATNIFLKATKWFSFKILKCSTRENILCFMNLEKLQEKIIKNNKMCILIKDCKCAIKS